MLYLDLETYNERDISVGTYRYAETAEVLLFAYAFEDGPVKVWDRTREPFPGELWNWLKDDSVLLTAHNALFDRTMIAHALDLPTRLERWRCTMAKAYSHAFPGSLEACGAALGLPKNKAKLADGKKLIHRFCKPAPSNHKADRYDHTTHPDEWQKFKDYAAMDIEAMREVDKRLPDWNWKDSDIAMYHLDQRINDRGFRVDQELTEAGAKAATADKARMAQEFIDLTGGTVERPTQRDKFCGYLNTRFGLGLDNTRAETFRDILNSETDIDPDCRRLMEISILSNKTSTAKYATLAPAVSSDGRFRGGLQFRGAARTRRWAGRTFQPQNLPSRGLPAQRSVDTYIRALKADAHEFLFDDLMLYGSAALRGVVIAPDDQELAVADLSNIEGRILAWLAGETWKIKAFFDYDAGNGPDLYNITATSILGGDPYKVPKSTRNVFGKVPDLACLSGDTKVLTDNGLKKLVDVSVADKLWDGVEWVTHKGLLNRGRKQTIEIDGVKVTPDHLIKTGRTWKQAGQLASNGNTLYQALATGSATLPFPISKPVQQVACDPSVSNAIAEHPTTKSISAICGLGELQAVLSVRSKRLHEQGVPPLAQKSARTISGGYQIGQALRFAGVTIPQTLHSQTTVGAGSPSTSLGGSAVPHSSNIWRALTAGTIRHLNWIAKTLTAITSQETYGSLRGSKTATTNEPSGNCKNASITWKNVYDIAHAGPRNRFTIKTDSGYLIVHNCGYEGGYGAFETFCKSYGVSMADHEETIRENVDPKYLSSAKANYTKWGADRNPEADKAEWLAREAIKLAWRGRHPKSQQLWKSCKEAAKQAILNPNRSYPAGPWLKFAVKRHAGNTYLLCRLPSGNFLCYFAPRYHEKDDVITYMGIDSTATGGMFGKWQRLYTYGGKIVENACQSLAMDIMAANMGEIDRSGFPIILTVHDEILAEPDSDGAASDLAEMMSKSPEWLPNFPLAAAGFDTFRYRKD